MEINTRIFGKINISDDKLIHFPNGIIGFADLKDFALIHDEEKGDNGGIRWLQSVQEPAFAMPVVNPLSVCTDYNPEVEDELLKPLGNMGADDMLVLVTITVPSDLTKMTVNLKAPFVINANNRNAAQIIVEGEQYQVKFPVYEILQKTQKAGE
ncbi:MAG: flagellar assembly protein FliW [Lachnospiraceae bacterium]|nr:flagellar assembly protein FliW [Lachnospiraceae bacterium]